MPREVESELRFTFSPEDHERIVLHPLLVPGLRRRQTCRLVSTYFDTPDCVLHRHRFGLRIRRSEQAITHTLKQTDGSLVARGEWERSHDDTEPDVGWLRGTPAGPLLREERVVSSLGPRFSVDVTRTILPLRRRKSKIEVAVDQGTIAAAGGSLALNEIELEVKRGRTSTVLYLARKLACDLPIVLTLASKAERGYGLSDLTWGQPVEAIAPALHKRMTIEKAFESIVQSCLDVLLRNLALIRTDEDGEALHSARIALRHLRAACQLFRPVVRRKRFASLRPQIKWLSDKLGAARDADVFQASFYDPAARAGDVPGAQALATLMGAHRRAAHGKLRAGLASARARLLFVDLLTFSTDGIKRRSRCGDSRPFVRRALEQRRRALAKQARYFPDMTASAMHDVRKAAKMLRYDLDLFAGVPKLGTAKRVRRLGTNLKVLQQTLGALNDDEAMRAHLRKTVLRRGAMDSRSVDDPQDAFVAAAQICAQRTTSDVKLKKATRAARKLIARPGSL